MNFKSCWDKNREWQLELPRKEIAECVCASTDTVAVATSERYIRMFSHGGAQMKLLSVPGQIVTLSANLEQLFYIYHRAQGFEGEQYLSCGTISSKRSNKKRGPQPLPQEIGLSSGSQLSCAGFTDDGLNITGTIYSLQARGYSSDAQMEELVQKWITKGTLKLLLGATIRKTTRARSSTKFNCFGCRKLLFYAFWSPNNSFQFFQFRFDFRPSENANLSRFSTLD